jgi:hypothetical protein
MRMEWHLAAQSRALNAHVSEDPCEHMSGLVDGGARLLPYRTAQSVRARIASVWSKWSTASLDLVRRCIRQTSKSLDCLAKAIAQPGSISYALRSFNNRTCRCFLFC